MSADVQREHVLDVAAAEAEVDRCDADWNRATAQNQLCWYGSLLPRRLSSFAFNGLGLGIERPEAVELV